MAEVACPLLGASQLMQVDDWWWQGEQTTHKAIKRQILKVMPLRRLFINH
jgi:hypothetical protein